MTQNYDRNCINSLLTVKSVLFLRSFHLVVGLANIFVAAEIRQHVFRRFHERVIHVYRNCACSTTNSERLKCTVLRQIWSQKQPHTTIPPASKNVNITSRQLM